MNAILTNNVELIMNYYNISELEICEHFNINLVYLQKVLVFSDKYLELYNNIKQYVYERVNDKKKQYLK